MYEDCKVYGPYTQSYSDRKFVLIVWPDGSKKTTSNARYLMEKHLNRELSMFEEVDHIDNDSSNDEIINLQVLSKQDNIEKSKKLAKEIEVTCECCGSEFSILYSVFKRNQITLNKKGPYCSKSCAGTMHN